MKLKIRYATKERTYVTEHTYRPVDKAAELTPVRIVRFPCGTGAAASRYYYSADFSAPDDAFVVHNGLMRTQIVRKLNPHFDPKKLEWTGDVCNTPSA
jgi:hypothetical protein